MSRTYDWLVVEPYPSEKYESQLGLLFPIIIWKNKTCSKPPTRNSIAMRNPSKQRKSGTAAASIPSGLDLERT